MSGHIRNESWVISAGELAREDAEWLVSNEALKNAGSRFLNYGPRSLQPCDV